MERRKYFLKFKYFFCLLDSACWGRLHYYPPSPKNHARPKCRNSCPVCVLQGSRWLCESPGSSLVPGLLGVQVPRINPLTPNDLYMGRTSPLTSKRCILYIYSTNVGTEYFKHDLHSPFSFSLQNAVCFVMLTCLVPVLFIFYIQDVLKLKK